ncbi:MAG: GGDEF domain-containing protein [Oscillospiraceae bacterium]|nr:GGDEF domain-containing protein [Oscillospiraceae bacterium]
MEKSGKKQRIGNMLVLLLLIFIIVAVLLTVEYLTMTYGKRKQAYQTAEVLIDQVRSVITTNDKNEKTHTETLKEEYVSKAKAVSYIIDNVPGVEGDISELVRIAALMSIDEINIFDDKGKIYAGTVPPYYGYTFDSGEQMAFFKPMLENKALSMCQDITPNTAEGKSMMYAICWSDNGERMIQIGIEPRRLIEEMRKNEISDVVAGMPSYDGVDIIVAHRYTGEILGSTSYKQIGNNIKRLGIDLGDRSLYDIEHFKATVSTRPSYCSASALRSYTIIVVQDKSVVNRDIPFVMVMIFLYLMLAAAAIVFIVRRMTNHILAERYNANTDPMTGFLNRRAYETELKKHSNGKRDDDLVYISIDLNGLKVTNDSFGHEAGDELICGAADCMRSSFGSCGKLYRIGGDEFVALINAGESKLEALRLEYDQSVDAWSEGREWKLSTAYGIVRTQEFPDKSLTEIARLADERMYAAKAQYYRETGMDRRKR